MVSVLLWQRKQTGCWVASARASPAKIKSLSHSSQHLSGHTWNTLFIFGPNIKKDVDRLESIQRRGTKMIKRLGSL